MVFEPHAASGESQKETTGMKLEVLRAKIRTGLVFGMNVLFTKLHTVTWCFVISAISYSMDTKKQLGNLPIRFCLRA